MKKVLLLFFFIYFGIAAAQQKNTPESFQLTGHLTGRDTGYIYLRYLNANGKDIRDSARLNNGDFRFSGSVKGAYNAWLRGVRSTISVSDPNSVSLFLENNDITVNLTQNDFKHAKIIGSKTQSEADALEDRKKALNQRKTELNSRLRDLEKSVKSGDTLIGTSKKIRLIRSELSTNAEKNKKLDYAFIQEYPKSYLSSQLLTSYFIKRIISLDSTESFFGSFGKENRESTFGETLEREINSRKASIVGAKAPGFALTNVNGGQLKLENFKGKKYVLVVFWASWCVPCRDEIPRLKEIYQKYNPTGLDIVSISVDTDRKAWTKAVDTEQMAWHQVLDPIPFQNEGLMMKYSIPNIPLIVMVDKTGIIIGRYDNGLTAELEKDLRSIFE